MPAPLLRPATDFRGIRLLVAATLATLMLAIPAAPGAPASAPPPARAPAAPAPAASPNPGLAKLASLAAGANVAIIRIEGMIYDFTLESLAHRVDRAAASGATLVVLEITTDGGLATSALDISRFIKNMDLPTVAWIRRKAYSAGIIIAAACDAIIMTPSSATGDAAPIVLGQNLAPTERAKFLSPLLADFKDSAVTNGYDYAPFHAMCVLGIEVYLVEHKQTGVRRLVNQVDYAFMVQGVDPNAPGAASPAPADADDVAGPSLGAFPDELGQYRLVDKVHDGKTLLTLSEKEAVRIGLAQAVVADDTQLAATLNANGVMHISSSWVVTLAGLLSNIWVRAILIVVLILGLFIEAQTGTGIAAAAALLALVALLGAPYLVGLAEIWHLALFLIGVALMVLEIFVLPGFGVAGISGLLCMVVGLVLAVVPTSGSGPLPMPPAEMVTQARISLLGTLIAFGVAAAGLYLLMKHFGTVPGLGRLILSTPASDHRGGVAQAAIAGAAAMPGDRETTSSPLVVGAVGRVITDLRPVGRAEFDGTLHDVVTYGEWLTAGTRVRIIEVRGNRIVVDQVTA